MSASEIQPPFYSQEEVQQILQLAIARQAFQGEFERQQLLEIAQELEIDKSCLQAAEKDWLTQKNQDRKQRAFNSYRRNQLKQKVAKYAIVNTFMVSLDVMVNSTLSFSHYILLVWGLFLSLNAWKTFQTRGEAYEKAFQRWQLRYEMKRSLETLWDRLQKAWQT